MRKKIQASPSVGRLTQRRAQDDQLIQVANKKTGLSRWPKKTGLSRSLLLALYVTMHWYWSNKQVFCINILCCFLFFLDEKVIMVDCSDDINEYIMSIQYMVNHWSFYADEKSKFCIWHGSLPRVRKWPQEMLYPDFRYWQEIYFLQSQHFTDLLVADICDLN